jgi:hypothetical protein
MADPPPFTLTGARYDQSTFVGRYRRTLDVIDPRTLLVGDAEVHRPLPAQP